MSFLGSAVCRSRIWVKAVTQDKARPRKFFARPILSNTRKTTFYHFRQKSRDATQKERGRCRAHQTHDPWTHGHQPQVRYCWFAKCWVSHCVCVLKLIPAVRQIAAKNLTHGHDSWISLHEKEHRMECLSLIYLQMTTFLDVFLLPATVLLNGDWKHFVAL